MAKRTSATSKAASKKVAPAIPAADPAAAAVKAGVSSAAKIPGTPKAAQPAVTRDAIARRAYEIWERKGRPIGKDLENWQEAERELGVR